MRKQYFFISFRFIFFILCVMEAFHRRDMQQVVNSPQKLHMAINMLSLVCSLFQREIMINYYTMLTLLMEY